MPGWGEARGPEVEAQLRAEVKEMESAYDTLWHRLGYVKRQVQQALTRYDTHYREDTAGSQLARDLRALLVEALEQRPTVPSPHVMRLKHMTERDAITNPQRHEHAGATS